MPETIACPPAFSSAASSAAGLRKSTRMRADPRAPRPSRPVPGNRFPIFVLFALVLLLIVYFIEFHFPKMPATLPPARMSCPAFTQSEQSCTFDQTRVVWISTGRAQNATPCIYPLPPLGHYTLLYRDGTTWTPGSQGDSSAYGFRSNEGSQTIKYFLSRSGHCLSSP